MFNDCLDSASIHFWEYHETNSPPAPPNNSQIPRRSPWSQTQTEIYLNACVVESLLVILTLDTYPIKARHYCNN